MICVSWHWDRWETSKTTPCADTTRFPNLVGELIVIPDHTVYPEEPLAAVERSSLVFRKGENSRRPQRRLSFLFYDEFNWDDIGILGAGAEIRMKLPSDRFNAKRPQLQWRSPNVFYGSDGAIVPVLEYPRDGDPRADCFQFEANPGEDRSFSRNQHTELRDSSIGNFRGGLRLISQRAFLSGGGLTQLPHGLQEALHVVSLYPGIAPQPVRRAPEIKRKYGERHRCERADYPIVFISEVSRTDGDKPRTEIKSREPGDEPGVTFMKFSYWARYLLLCTQPLNGSDGLTMTMTPKMPIGQSVSHAITRPNRRRSCFG